MRRNRRAVLLVAGALLLAACRTAPEREAARATSALIEMAPTREERAVLTHIRDEANAEMRREAQALDDEIRQLREENAALAARLNGR